MKIPFLSSWSTSPAADAEPSPTPLSPAPLSVTQTGAHRPGGRTSAASPGPSYASALSPLMDAPGLPRHRGGLLDSLRRKLRPGPLNVTAGPFYVHTSMPPLQLNAGKTGVAAHAVKTPGAFSPATDQWIQQHATGLVHHLHSAAPTALSGLRAQTLEGLRRPLAFAAAVEALFIPDADETLPATPLRALIAALTTAIPLRESSPPALRYAQALQLGRALAASTNGQPAAALAALAALPHVAAWVDRCDVAEEEPGTTSAITSGITSGTASDTTSGTATPPADTTLHMRQAWHAASLLSSTPSGFEALVAMSEAPELRAVDEAGAMRRESLQTFLQATLRLNDTAPTSATPMTDAAPRGVEPAEQMARLPAAFVRQARERLARRDPVGADAGHTLAQQALLCAAALYRSPMATAAEIGAPAQVDAFVSWRSGYREMGPSTALARTQSRMAKFLTWVQRAENRASNPAVAFDPRRWVGMQKSPLTAAAYTAGGANLGLAMTEAVLLQNSVDAALGAASIRLGALADWRAAPTERRVLWFLQQQCLAHWATLVATGVKPSTLVLSSRDRDAIAVKAAAAATRHGLAPEDVVAHPLLRKQKRLDLQTLQRWLQEAPDIGGAAAPGPDRPTAETLVSQAIDLQQMRPIRPTGSSRAHMRDALRQVIDKTPLGNNVRYFDGANYGLNVNHSVNAKDLKQVIGLSIGPGYKALQGRHGFLEIGSSSYGGEIFMGVDQRTSRGGSFGVFGGVALGADDSIFHVSLGGGIGMGYSHDRMTPCGVIIRTQVQRHPNGKPTDSWRHQANRVLDFLFDQSPSPARPDPVPPAQLWSAFSAHFFRDRDISVNWRDQERSNHTVSSIGNAMARFSVAGWHFGPSLAVSHDHLVSGRNERVDANGWLSGLERSRAKSSAVNTSLALVSASASPGHFAKHPGQPESLSLPSVPLVGVAGTFIPKGASVTLRMVDEHGDLHPGYIRCLVEFLDPANFMAYLAQRKPLITRSEASRQRLDNFIQEVDSAAHRGNQAFGESRKLRPEVVALLNGYRDELTMIRQCTSSPIGPQSGASPTTRDQAQISLLDDEMARLLNDPGSWKLSGYYTYEINTAGYTAGPAFIGQATAVTASNGERVLAELAVAELEALDAQELQETPETSPPGPLTDAPGVHHSDATETSGEGPGM